VGEVRLAYQKVKGTVLSESTKEVYYVFTLLQGLFVIETIRIVMYSIYALTEKVVCLSVNLYERLANVKKLQRGVKL